MKKIYMITAALVSISVINAQTKPVTDTTTFSKNLSELIVTGQYKPQSVKNSVYQVRVINSERIRISGAANVQQVLNTQLGFRFSNDNTLGTTDVKLMGMSGRNVKILLDGVPMLDRGDTRESLNQIDVNSIERIEIVEGPMSVSYGSDALAGVINIITKKNAPYNISVTAKLQEETAGSEYHPFNYKGLHTQNIGVSLKKNNWYTSFGGTHIEFDGFGGDDYGRGKTWKPKEQWMGNAKIGYAKAGFNVYYRLDGLDETITVRNAINFNTNKSIDQLYVTHRLLHQVQGSYTFNPKLQLSSLVGYTDYSRSTKTTRHDFEKNTEELTTGDGEQDISRFNSFVFRNTLYWQLSSKVSLQPGIDINSDKASGQRIEGSPVITDIALFASAEIKPTDKINIRPGVRFIKNSVYNAPPAIPSVNAKFNLSKQLDLRFAYAYGFRSPALRELYFYYVDVNHNIVGNPDLKAENSNNFSAGLHWTAVPKNDITYNASLTTFYNVFNNQIDFALASASSNQYTYFNINKAKTTGANFENRISWKKIDAAFGLSYIGYYRKQYDDKDYTKIDNKDFLWSPEINAVISYNAAALKTKFNVLYKYTGKKPQYVYGTNSSNQSVLYIANISSFNWADFTATTTVNKYVAVSTGVKNIFDVNNINNTATSSGSIHSGAGPVPVSYGRSYFIGLNFQWNKK
jgi:outer membrane receptor for ferrienterochelin and colicins